MARSMQQDGKGNVSELEFRQEQVCANVRVTLTATRQVPGPAPSKISGLQGRSKLAGSQARLITGKVVSNHFAKLYPAPSCPPEPRLLSPVQEPELEETAN